MIVSREGSSKFNTRSSQKHRVARGFLQTDRFVRVFFQISQKKLAKASLAVVRVWWSAIVDRGWWSTKQASKTSVSREASDNFHRKSFQNDRFVRGFFEITQHKLAKRAFRAMLPTVLTQKASKTIVSCEAFQNDRFVRGFLEISQKKLPKRSFRARLPRKFHTEQASRTIVSRDTIDNFHRNTFSKFNRTSFQNELFARLPPNFIQHFQNERFARCFRQFPEKICISNLYFAAVSCNGGAEFCERVPRAKQNVRLAITACHAKFRNARFTAACAKMYEFCKRVAPAKSKFAFHHSFGRPIRTKRREGCQRTQANSHFTSVRRARSDERVATTACTSVLDV